AQGRHGGAERRPGVAARASAPGRADARERARAGTRGPRLWHRSRDRLTNNKETTTMNASLLRRGVLAAGAALALAGWLPAAQAQSKVLLRISTPAVPDDWHAKMWTVFKDSLDKSAPGEFDVQINLNASLFKQGTEPAAMARGNLELSSISAFDIAKLVPEFSVFTAGYIIRDPQHQQKV